MVLKCLTMHVLSPAKQPRYYLRQGAECTERIGAGFRPTGQIATICFSTNLEPREALCRRDDMRVPEAEYPDGAYMECAALRVKGC